MKKTTQHKVVTGVHRQVTAEEIQIDNKYTKIIFTFTSNLENESQNNDVMSFIIYLSNTIMNHLGYILGNAPSSNVIIV